MQAPHRIVAPAFCAALFASLFVCRCARDASPLQTPSVDTLSSAQVPATCVRIVEKLDDTGRVVESYMAQRFAFQHRPVRMTWASDKLTEDDVRGPAGGVVFETDDGRRVFLSPPWRIP